GEAADRRCIAYAESGARCAEHVRESGARDVRVDQRTHGAELGDGADGEQEEGAVGREDRTRVARPEAGAGERRGEAIHLTVVRAEADRLVLELERRSIRNALGLLLDEATERIGRSTEFCDELSEVHRSGASRRLTARARPGTRQPTPCQVAGSQAFPEPSREGVPWGRRCMGGVGALDAARRSARPARCRSVRRWRTPKRPEPSGRSTGGWNRRRASGGRSWGGSRRGIGR